ncbi:MAG: alpha/beta hydrolase [Pelovirga sp.]
MLLYRILLLLAVASFSVACVPKAQIPVPVLEYGQIGTTGNTDLLIFLRGIGGSHTDFERFGLIDQVRDRGLPMDIVVPNTHYGYYKSETVVNRIKEDIIEPAKQQGYQRFWLAGFSMGGLGSLFYIREYPEDIEAVMLVSPFMGWGTIRREIKEAGGIRNWDADSSAIDNWQILIWTFIQDYIAAPESYPPVYLGYGTTDGVTKNGPSLLADALPKLRVFTLRGGHNYTTFQALWSEHLDRMEAKLSAAPPADAVPISTAHSKEQQPAQSGVKPE